MVSESSVVPSSVVYSWLKPWARAGGRGEVMKASASSWRILGGPQNQGLCSACLALFFPPEPWAPAIHSKQTAELSRLFHSEAGSLPRM